MPLLDTEQGTKPFFFTADSFNKILKFSTIEVYSGTAETLETHWGTLLKAAHQLVEIFHGQPVSTDAMSVHERRH